MLVLTTSSTGTYHDPFWPQKCLPQVVVSFSQQVLAALLPSPCLPPSNVGFEFEMFSLKTFLRGCLHDVHIRYFFDPLLPQGMEV